jgi:hypothetical protein
VTVESRVQSREALEAEISRRAAEFDPSALVRLLAYLGYRPEEILFESAAREVSQPTLVHRVEFRSEPVKQAIVTLNLGLLGTQSPLPSYFKRLVEDPDVDEQSFTDFLRFFDHRLLDAWLRSIYPEHDPAIFKDFEKTKQSYLRLLGLNSVSTLHWLIELTYPELGVTVEKGTIMRSVQLEGARLGRCELGGGAVLGGWMRAPVPGYLVTLYADEEHTEFGRPWAEEVMRRLERLVFPAVSEGAIELKVVLVVRSERVWAQLRPGSYLGFDRMKGGLRKNREIQVFKGEAVLR